jgi:hypothetical protein
MLHAFTKTLKAVLHTIGDTVGEHRERTEPEHDAEPGPNWAEEADVIRGAGRSLPTAKNDAGPPQPAWHVVGPQVEMETEFIAGGVARMLATGWKPTDSVDKTRHAARLAALWWHGLEEGDLPEDP